MTLPKPRTIVKAAIVSLALATLSMGTVLSTGAMQPVQAAEPEFVKIAYAPAKKAASAICKTKYPAKGNLAASFLHIQNKTCYSCPRGYKRTANKLNGPKACKARGGKNARVAQRGKPGCAKGSFRHGLTNQCYTCPSSYKRSLAPGKDLSKVKKACVHVKITPAAALPPKVRDWMQTALPKIKQDYLPLIKKTQAYAKEFNKPANRKALRQLRRAAKKGKSASLPAQSTLKKMHAASAAQNESMEAGTTSAKAESGEAAAADNFKIKTISVGLIMDISIGIGASYSPMTVGIDIRKAKNRNQISGNFDKARLSFYTAAAGTVGPSGGGAGGVEIGFWVDDFENLAGNSWGVTLGAAKAAGVSVTVWFKWADKDKKQPVKFSGVTLSGGAGLKIEGEVAAASTSRITWEALKDVM